MSAMLPSLFFQLIIIKCVFWYSLANPGCFMNQIHPCNGMKFGESPDRDTIPRRYLDIFGSGETLCCVPESGKWNPETNFPRQDVRCELISNPYMMCERWSASQKKTRKDAVQSHILTSQS